MTVVGVQRAIDVAVAKLPQGLLLPPFALAAVGGQLGTGHPLGEGGEQTTGIDLRELLRIADENDLRSGPLGVVECASEHACADHPGFVDHEHGVGFHRRPVEPSQQSRQRRGRDAGGRLELGGGAGGERGADDLIAGCLPDLAGRLERVGLAAACRRGEHVDAVP